MRRNSFFAILTAVLVAAICVETAEAAPATTRHLAAVAVDINKLEGQVRRLRAKQRRMKRALGRCRSRYPVGHPHRGVRCAPVRVELQKLDRRVAANEGRIAALEAQQRRIKRRLAKVEGRVDATEARQEESERRISRNEGRNDAQDERLDGVEEAAETNARDIDDLFGTSPYFKFLGGFWTPDGCLMGGLGFGFSLPANQRRWRAATEVLFGGAFGGGGEDGMLGFTLVERLHANSGLSFGGHARFGVNARTGLKEATNWFLGAGPSFVFSRERLEVSADLYIALDKNEEQGIAPLLGGALTVGARF